MIISPPRPLFDKNVRVYVSTRPPITTYLKPKLRRYRDSVYYPYQQLKSAIVQKYYNQLTDDEKELFGKVGSFFGLSAKNMFIHYLAEEIASEYKRNCENQFGSVRENASVYLIERGGVR